MQYCVTVLSIPHKILLDSLLFLAVAIRTVNHTAWCSVTQNYDLFKFAASEMLNNKTALNSKQTTSHPWDGPQQGNEAGSQSSCSVSQSVGSVS